MISTTARAISYTADGVQTVYSFPYAIISTDHLTVSVAGAVVTGYTAALNTNPDTGLVVTFTSAPTANATVLLSRGTPIDQLVDYTPGDSFNAETHENALDKLTLILQEYDDDLSRTYKAVAGTSTITRATTAMYGKYLALNSSGDLVGLDETVISGGGGGGSTFDMEDASDLDTVTTAAAGTTTITIPDTATPVFGMQVTADAGAGSYTHNIDLPAPGSTGQRAFIRVRYSSVHDSTINIRDNAATTLVSLSGQRKHFFTDVRMVANGSAWIVDNIQRGDAGYDRFIGAAYNIPADPATIPLASEIIAAAADSNPATIYLDNIISMGETPINIPERHTLVISNGSGFTNLANLSEGAGSLILDCEVITATTTQAIFEDCEPGVVRGKFGGKPVNPKWWDDKSTVMALLYPDDWVLLQGAVMAADWQADGTPVTITNWNDTTNFITVADTNAFAEGDVVSLSGTLGANLSEDRLLVVANATSGAGTTLSTFQLKMCDGSAVVSFGTGGSLSATVTKMKARKTHRVDCLESSYTIDRPIHWHGTGAALNGNGATIGAIAGNWSSQIEESENFTTDHAPMLVLGETGPTEWSGLPSGVENVTLDGGDIDLVSGIGSGGHIPRRSYARNIEIFDVTRHYVGWAKAWTAAPGYAAANDTSYLNIKNFYFHDIVDSGADPAIPIYMPGYVSSVTDGSVYGDTGTPSERIILGANQRGLMVRNVEFGEANIFLEFSDDALFLSATLDNVFGSCEPLGTVSVTSTDTATETFTSVGHGLLDGDVIRHNGTGTPATGWSTTNAYFVTNKTANTFQVYDTPDNTATPFDMTADNGAFSVEKPGALIDFQSAQANAKVSATALVAYDNALLLRDISVHDRMVTGADDRSVAAGHRRVDALTWGATGYSYTGNGVLFTRAVVLRKADTQYDMGLSNEEVALMSFDIAGPEAAFIVKHKEASNTRWKSLNMTNANQQFLNYTTDPEV